MSKETKGIRNKSTSALADEIRELREQLFKLRWQASSGQTENPNRIRAVRREIARHLTVLRERELGAGRTETT